MYVEIRGHPCDNGRIRRVFVGRFAIDKGISPIFVAQPIRKDEVVDIVVETIYFKIDVFPIISIGNIHFVSCFGLKVNIAQFISKGPGVELIAGSFIDGGGAIAFCQV